MRQSRPVLNQTHSLLGRPIVDGGDVNKEVDKATEKKEK